MGNSVSSAMARVRSMPERGRSPVKPRDASATASARRRGRRKRTAVRQRRAPGDADDNQINNQDVSLPKRRSELERLARLSELRPTTVRVGRRAGVQRENQ